MANKKLHNNLSRRERQIMDIIYERGRATATEVTESLPDQPSNSAVRTILRVLEEKGHLRHEEENLHYVYVPTVPPEKASKSALKQVLRVFFNDSAEQSVAAILDLNRSKLSDAELDRLAQLIEQARKDGR